MKVILACSLAFLCVLLATPPGSSQLLERLGSGLQKARQRTKCGLHRIGDTLFHHGHNGQDPCEQHGSTEFENGENRIDVNAEPTRKPVEKDFARGDQVTRENHMSTSTEYPTVPGGKRLISAGSNCPPGYKGDGKGNCREEY